MSEIENHYKYMWTTHLEEFILVATESGYAIMRVKKGGSLIDSLIIEHDGVRQMVIEKLREADVKIMTISELKQLRSDLMKKN